MQSSQSPMFWSFPAGSLLATRIRISVFFPLLFLVLLFRLDAQVALAVAAILLVSTLLHELLGHVLIARYTGGAGNEVLLWPVGGLAYVQPTNTFTSQFFTAAGGPLVNLVICLAFLPTILWVDGGTRAFNPFVLPIAEFSAAWFEEFLILVFFINWLSVLVNLLPIYPLDGGRMLEACLIGQGTTTERKRLCLNIGTIAAIILSAIGLMFDNVWAVFLASLLLVLNVLESVNVQFGESFDDSFMGYDFSQGYTSLERSASQTNVARKSFWARRREAREAKKALHLAEQRQREAEQLDALLAKVHTHGIAALTPHERKFLDRTSKNLRTKGS